VLRQTSECPYNFNSDMGFRHSITELYQNLNLFRIGHLHTESDMLKVDTLDHSITYQGAFPNVPDPPKHAWGIFPHLLSLLLPPTELRPNRTQDQPHTVPHFPSRFRIRGHHRICGSAEGKKNIIQTFQCTNVDGA